VDPLELLPAKIPRPPRAWRRMQRADNAAVDVKQQVTSNITGETAPAVTAAVESVVWPHDVLGLICSYLPFTKSLLFVMYAKILPQNQNLTLPFRISGSHQHAKTRWRTCFQSSGRLSSHSMIVTSRSWHIPRVLHCCCVDSQLRLPTAPDRL
jgi:hypothetical protein